VLAVSALILSLGMRSVEPLHGAYGDQAMLAFELARTPEQLAQVIGTNPPSAEALAVRRVLDRANHIDFLYMALYAIFVALSCASLAQTRRRSWLWLGVALGPLAALFDVMENLALLALTRADADVPELLGALQLRTGAKWTLLALSSALYAAGFAGGSSPAWFSAVAILVALALVAAGGLALADPASFIAPLAYGIVIVWLWQLAHAARTAFAGRGA
jgi:hypothetical protein